MHCPQARLDHATAVGEQQKVVEEEERAKMAALAEQMSNESAQRQGEIRRRHEAAMAKLTLNREQQVYCLWHLLRVSTHPTLYVPQLMTSGLTLVALIAAVPKARVCY